MTKSPDYFFNPPPTSGSLFGKIRRDDETVPSKPRSELLADWLINRAKLDPKTAMDLYLSTFVTIGSFETPGAMFFEEDPRNVRLKINITKPRGLG
jgi:hypothetical protein